MGYKNVFVESSLYDSRCKIVSKRRNKLPYKRTYRTQLIIFVLVFSLFLSGCSLIKGNSPNTLTITPVELYGGDKDKFKPFLGLYSGSVKLEYTGEKKNLGVNFQVWENGISNPDTKGGISDLMFNLEGEKVTYNSELIVSIKPISLDQVNYYEVTLSLFTESGSSTSTQYIERNEEHSFTSFKKLYEEISLEDSGEAVVMGVEGTTSNIMRTKTIEQAKEEAEWFLGISVFLEDEEDIFP